MRIGPSYPKRKAQMFQQLQELAEKIQCFSSNQNGQGSLYTDTTFKKNSQR